MKRRRAEPLCDAPSRCAEPSRTEPLHRTAVLVRSHNPHECGYARIKEYAASSASSGCTFCVSVDISQAPGRQAASRLQAELGANAVHTYSEATLRKSYPVLAAECTQRADAGSKQLWRRWGNPVREGQHCAPASLAWGFHLEAINLWAQRQHGEAFDFVWILEDDVGFSGDLCRDLCAAYTADASDLITAEYSPVFAPLPTRSRKLVSRWCWQQTASDAFLALVGQADRHKGPEHVQRFSRRYLDRLHELASGREPGRMTAWSEMGAPSLCLHLGLTVGRFDACHVGTPFSFNGRVSPEEWEALKKQGHGKLYHALKF